MPGPETITGVRWRSKSSFILTTVAFCLFTDLFLYALVVPILLFLLQDRLGLPVEDVQPYTSGLLAAYSGASVLFSISSGWIADRFSLRKPTYPHRDKVILWQLSDMGEHGSLPRESFEFLRDPMNSVTKFLAPNQWGKYANFIDTESDGKVAQDLYWGGEISHD